MAVIALKGTSFDYAMGMGVFDGLSMAFSDAKRTTSTLHDALSTLKSKIDVAATATSVDTSQTQAQQAQARESTKKSSLTLAYEKLDALISDTGRVDQRASSKISSREDDFYKRYYYLKPECKKTDKEKRDDWWAERWQNFKDFWGGVGNAIANIAKNVVDFCKEHWKEILKVLAVVALVVTSVLLLIFVPGGGLLSAILLGAAKGCLIGLVTSVAMNGIVNKCNGRGFWEGSIDAAFSGAVGGFIGGGITGGLLGNGVTMGKVATKGLLSATHSFGGAIAQGAFVGAISSSASNAGVTALSYWMENGTLKGSSGAILQSAVSGAISGGILGGVMGGAQYKYSEFKLHQLENKIAQSNLSPTQQGKLYETELVEEFGKRNPNLKYDSQCHLNSSDLLNSKGNSSYQMPDLLVEGKNGQFTNYDFKWGNAGKTFNQKVLTGVGGTTAGIGTGSTHVLDTTITNSSAGFTTNVVPSGTPFIEIHQGTFNNIIGVPLNSDIFIGSNSGLQSILNTVSSR